MPFNAQVFRILIASPSDVSDERAAAIAAIQEWNNRNAADRQIVLLPLAWESHATPAYGERPQAIINRQVVDYCDMLVGIFWMRLGTPTGVAEAGTVEEIERVAASGRRVMLYFSSARANPDDIDPAQLAALREFKKRNLQNALIDNYSTVTEFRDKLFRHLDSAVKELASGSTDSEEGPPANPPSGWIELHFANPDTGADLGSEITADTAHVVINDFDTIRDYQSSEPTETAQQHDAGGFVDWLAIKPKVNRDYYRQRASALVAQLFFKPVRFWLKNTGAVGVRDIRVDLSFDTDKEVLIVRNKAELPTASPPTTLGSLLGFGAHKTTPEEALGKVSKSWTTGFDLNALQPQRERSPDTQYVIGATESCDVNVTATVYGDILSEPVVRKLKITFRVQAIAIPAEQVTAAFLDPEPQKAVQAG